MPPAGPLLGLLRRGCIEPRTYVAVHETGHVLVALVLAKELNYATIDFAAHEGGGEVSRPGEEREGLGDLLITIAGPLAEREPIVWPPVDRGDGSDESHGAKLVAALDLDRDGWDEANALVREIFELPHVIRARKAIVAALYERGTLIGVDLRRLYDAATREATSDLERESED